MIDTESHPGTWQRALDRGCLTGRVDEFRTHGADSAVDDELPGGEDGSSVAGEVA